MSFKTIIAALGSMRVTVICLAAGMVLVLLGTLAQVNHGIYNVQKEYFQSLIAFWGPSGADWKIPIPGGYLIGGVLLVNLVAAQILVFELSRRRFGLQLIHGGLILLLVGQLFTDLFQVESHMRLTEGQPVNYSESSLYTELVLVDTSQPDRDTVVSIPEDELATGREITNPALPFTLRIKKHYLNSLVENRAGNEPGKPEATQGIGETVKVTPRPRAARMDERNVPASLIEVVAEGKSLGTWMFSLVLDSQPVQYAGKTWQVALRSVRVYKPFSITLLKFTHEKYPGTDIPKNFASRIRVDNPGTGEQRESLIYMNNPLRYGGETFYQGSYDPNDPRVSILQVVRNPSWLTPYIACILVGLGMCFHFMMHLMDFITRKFAASRKEGV
ncbi:MAG: cytochrome c biogenesis protein ResB [Verrucomicrobiota bacterium]